jgi:hypothetical protein
MVVPPPTTIPRLISVSAIVEDRIVGDITPSTVDCREQAPSHLNSGVRCVVISSPTQRRSSHRG